MKCGDARIEDLFAEMRLWLFILNFPNRKVEEAIAHVRIVAK
jgi:hypothetical protein